MSVHIKTGLGGIGPLRGLMDLSFIRSGLASRVNASGAFEEVAANVPRFDFDPSALTCNGLRIDPSSANRALDSQAANGWVAAGTTPPTVTNNSTYDGESCVKASFTAAMTGTGYSGCRADRSGQGFSFTSGQKESLSIYVQLSRALVTGESFFVYWTGAEGFGGTTIDSTNSAEFVGKWMRVTEEGHTWASSGTDYATLYNAGTIGSNIDIYLCREQVETKGFCTSYIPTDSGSPTETTSRGDEKLTLSSLATAVPNPDEMSFFVEFGGPSAAAIAAQSRTPIDFGGTDALADYAFPYIQQTTGTIYLGSSYSSSLSAGVTLSGGESLVRIAGGWDASTISISAQGSATQSGSKTGSFTDLIYCALGHYSYGNNSYITECLKKAAVYDRKLSDEQFKILSGGGTIPIKPVIEFDFTASAILDATHPRILYDNLALTAPAASVSASSAAANFPADAAQRPDTFEYWKPTTFPAIWTADLGAAKVVDAVGIASHQCGTTAVGLKVQWSVDNASWYDATDTVYPADNGEVLFLFAPQLARYWRLYMTASGSPTEYPQVGVIYIGRSLPMQRSLYAGHSPITLSRQTTLRNQLSEGGHFLGQSIQRRGLTGAAAFRFLEPVWYRDYFDPFAKSARRYPYFFAWRPETYTKEVAYAWTREDIAPTNSGAPNFVDVSFNMQGYDGRE